MDTGRCRPRKAYGKPRPLAAITQHGRPGRQRRSSQLQPAIRGPKLRQTAIERPCPVGECRAHPVGCGAVIRFQAVPRVQSIPVQSHRPRTPRTSQEEGKGGVPGTVPNDGSLGSGARRLELCHDLISQNICRWGVLAGRQAWCWSSARCRGTRRQAQARRDMRQPAGDEPPFPAAPSRGRAPSLQPFSPAFTAPLPLPRSAPQMRTVPSALPA